MRIIIASSLTLLSLSAQAQINVGGAAQGQSSTQGQSLNINTQYNGVKQHPVAGARTYVPPPTSDCMGSSGISGQAPFWGLGISTTTQSRPCNIRENAKIIGSLGDTELSERIIISLVCEDASIRKSMPECGLPLSNVCEYPTDECKKAKRFK